ncbi:MAG: DNA methyltransferase [Cellulomonadaceae bacterium]
MSEPRRRAQVPQAVREATDPGDLVLDPTCGSGTTAYVAEQWGRRWITVDTSRVALALARQRLMGARYPYDPPRRVASRSRSRLSQCRQRRSAATFGTGSSTSAYPMSPSAPSHGTPRFDPGCLAARRMRSSSETRTSSTSTTSRTWTSTACVFPARSRSSRSLRTDRSRSSRPPNPIPRPRRRGTPMPKHSSRRSSRTSPRPASPWMGGSTS